LSLLVVAVGQKVEQVMVVVVVVRVVT